MHGTGTSQDSNLTALTRLSNDCSVQMEQSKHVLPFLERVKAPCLFASLCPLHFPAYVLPSPISASPCSGNAVRPKASSFVFVFVSLSRSFCRGSAFHLSSAHFRDVTAASSPFSWSGAHWTFLTTPGAAQIARILSHERARVPHTSSAQAATWPGRLSLPSPPPLYSRAQWAS